MDSDFLLRREETLNTQSIGSISKSLSDWASEDGAAIFGSLDLMHQRRGFGSCLPNFLENSERI